MTKRLVWRRNSSYDQSLHLTKREAMFVGTANKKAYTAPSKRLERVVLVVWKVTDDDRTLFGVFLSSLGVREKIKSWRLQTEGSYRDTQFETEVRLLED